jgi:predicted nucleic acid-binding protein
VNYLADTNLVSELRKSNCPSHVRAFMNTLPERSVYISVITMGEIKYGLERLPPSKKKTEIANWLDGELSVLYSGRIIHIDIDIALEWGDLRARNDRTLPFLDSLLAATALSKGLTLLTRNTKDFDGIEGLSLVNPWEST